MEELAWLGVIRHGQSVGNLAADRAESAGVEVIDLALPDAEVPLSPLGKQQARGIGTWLCELPAEQRPERVLVSPYLRAVQTAGLALEETRGLVPASVDERLRDRELGVLDKLTHRGVAQRFPDEQARRRSLGKFYYRPPGGESWADVALRLRVLLRELRDDYSDRRVLLFAHEAVVFVLRYLIEGLSVADLVELGRGRLANAGLTSWRREGTGLRLAGSDESVSAAVPPTRQSHV
jgi:broad specificity phosphatase PhoE